MQIVRIMSSFASALGEPGRGSNSKSLQMTKFKVGAREFLRRYLEHLMLIIGKLNEESTAQVVGTVGATAHSS